MMRVNLALRFVWVIFLAMVVKDAYMFVVKFCNVTPKIILNKMFVR